MEETRRKPTVFVSSTCYDLKQVREDIKDFFERDYGFEAMLSEFDSFPIDPCIGTFENCLSNVDTRADFFVLIVGTRYGYVTEQGKSITNLEYLHAVAKGIPVFVFVSKQLYNTLPLWKANKEGDFSSVVDNPKIFEFVSDIYDKSHQWIYTYESVRDITSTMKNQLGLIFFDGLTYKKKTSVPQYSILKRDISAGAARVLIEKPYAWEYKFLAHTLKSELDKLQYRKWDFQYGIFEGTLKSMGTSELLDNISEKLNEIMKLMDVLSVLLNTTVQDAIGEPGQPSDLERMVYVSKQVASIYEKLIGWALYFKTVHVDQVFDKLLALLYELPTSALKTIEDFIERVFKEITAIPDVETEIQNKIVLTCALDAANTDEINREIARLATILPHQ